MNTLTDSLKLVQHEEERGTFHLFKRKRTERYGFAVVVFRQKALLGYIPSTDIMVESDIQRRYERMGRKNGDTIFSINLGPARLEIRETLPTRDGWPRAYQIELDIHVSDPVQFSQRYVQESDPVERAKTAIEGFIQQSAGLHNHDDIHDSMLREWARQALTVDPNTALGLRVMAVHKATVFMNAMRAKEIEIERQQHLDEKRIQGEGYIQRVKKQEELNLQNATVQGQIEIERLRAEERRKQHEQDVDLTLQIEEKHWGHTSKKVIVEAEDQLKLQQYTHKLEYGDVQQQITLDVIKNRHGQEMELSRLIEEYKQQVRRHEIDSAQNRHQLELDTRNWESKKQQEWIEQLGAGTMPALISRIREQIESDRSTLSGAVSEPELQYLLSILSGGKSTGPDLLSIPQDSSAPQSKVQVSPVSESATSATQETAAVPPLPGVTQQKEDIIAIPDLGLKLIQTLLSEEQRQRAAIETATGFIIALINEHGPAKATQLRVGDIMIELNGRELKTVQDISNAISAREADTGVYLYVLRGENLLEVKIDIPLQGSEK